MKYKVRLRTRNPRTNVGAKVKEKLIAAGQLGYVIEWHDVEASFPMPNERWHPWVKLNYPNDELLGVYPDNKLSEAEQ